MKRKCLAFLLVCFMVFAMLPGGILAAEVTASGTCGENLTWELTSDGVMTISGTGKMEDFIRVPWFEYRDRIMSLDLKNGMTSIGQMAFADCRKITSVTIPASVKSIEKNAFASCDGITNVELPDGLERIGFGAFQSCTKLESIKVPNSVGDIEERAFDSCSKLADVTLPEGLKSIKGYTFQNCASLKELPIPSSVTTIGEGAFRSCSGLTEVTIPRNIKRIENSAFEACNGLTGVVIPSSVTFIGEGAFSHCYALTDITIPESIKSIENYTFSNDWSLTDITIPASVTSIGESAFYYCYGLTDIIIPENVKTIERYAFADCTGLDTVLFCGSAPKMGENCFGGVVAYAYYPYDDASWTSKSRQDYGGALMWMLYDRETGVVTMRLAGSNRTATAAMISAASYVKSDAVILASSLNYADALAGAPLAYAMRAPILLVGKTLDEYTLAEIEALGARYVTILGGSAAVSEAVEDTLAEMGCTVRRVAGHSRYDTAVAIARELEEVTDIKATEAFIASGVNFPDALAVSSVAAIKGTPILFAAANGNLYGTADYLNEEDNIVESCVILGGEVAVGKSAVDNLKACGVRSVERIEGYSRYDTCLAINQAYAEILTGDELCVATGGNYPDALAGGAYAAIYRAPMLLVNNKTLSDAQKSYIKAFDPAMITVFGGTNAVSDKMLAFVIEAVR